MNSIFGLTGSFEINFVLAIFKVHDSYTHCQHQHNHSQDPTIAHTHCIPCIRTYFNTLLPSSLLFSPPSPSSHYEPITSPTAAATCCALLQQQQQQQQQHRSQPTTCHHCSYLYLYAYAHVEPHIPTLDCLPSALIPTLILLSCTYILVLAPSIHTHL